MKHRLGNVLLLVFSFSACSNSDGLSQAEEHTDASMKIVFTVAKDAGNFVTCTAGDETGAFCSWETSDGQKSSGTTACFYFERQGKYTVTLTQQKGSLRGSASQDIVIGEDSYYYAHGEHLWWNDEFNGSQLDATAWTYDTGTGQWGNNELETYTASEETAYLKDGMLHIRAIRTGSHQKEGDYVSARLTTRGKKEINRGRVEVRAKLPGGRGVWPAIWLFGRNAAPYYTELDMMEYVGYEPGIIYTTVHTTHSLASEDKVSAWRKLSDVETEFHTYGMKWSDGKIGFYVDNPDDVYLTYIPSDKSDPEVWPFEAKLYLILNVAVGGDWAGIKGIDDNAFPCEMLVEYVRIFQ